MSFVSHTLNTIFGMYQMKYNKDWDNKLNQLLDDHSESAKLLNHTVELGEFEVWVSNKWYCYGNAFYMAGKSIPKNLEFRPSIFTMRRLDRLVQDIKQRDKVKIKQELKEKAK